MKKLQFILAVLILSFVNVNAQENGDALSKGSWIIELNTGTPGNTGLYLSSSNGDTNVSVGADAGYFISDNLAIKGGLGISAFNFEEYDFVYKVGVKYYINGRLPINLDLTGVNDDANWIGLQGGYALFVADNLSIEPSVRYYASVDDNANDFFQALVGIVFHL